MSEFLAGFTNAHWTPPFWLLGEGSWSRYWVFTGQTQKHEVLIFSPSLFTRRKPIPEVIGIQLQSHQLYLSFFVKMTVLLLMISSQMNGHSPHKVAQEHMKRWKPEQYLCSMPMEKLENSGWVSIGQECFLFKYLITKAPRNS